MATTKKITGGIPVADANGVITTLSLAEIAKQVGKELGVQKASYSLSGPPRWIRLARVGTSAFVLLIQNRYGSTHSYPVILSVCAQYGVDYAHQASVKLLGGSPRLFSKVRVVSNKNDAFFEVYISTAQGGSDIWQLKAFHGDRIADATAYPELYTAETAGETPSGWYVNEFTIAQLVGGG